MERTAIRTEFLSDVLITATEGGINYWAHPRSRTWDGIPAEPGSTLMSAVLVDREELEGDQPTNKRHVIDHDAVERGIALILSTTEKFSVREDIYRMILLGHYKNDAGEIDAEAADVIVQAALFGEILYS